MKNNIANSFKKILTVSFAMIFLGISAFAVVFVGKYKAYAAYETRDTDLYDEAGNYKISTAAELEGLAYLVK